MAVLKIIIDSHIPYIKGAFDDVADVEYFESKDMTAAVVKNADALIIRTRTRCDKNLLEGSNVKFIATATIGYDHIDTKYCDSAGIKWTNAPGCNALSVTQYIASALVFLARKNHFSFADKTIGIVGVGAVGSRVALLAKSLGMRVLLNDPPRERSENSNQFVSLDTICEQADIITFHPFLNMEGEYKTFHLANESFFAKLKNKPILINSSRGEVVSTDALLNAISTGLISDVVLDCWEHEPNINTEMLTLAALATPHIAGYSADGKANATTQSVQSVSRFFNLGKDNWINEELPQPKSAYLRNDYTSPDNFYLSTYNIVEDSNKLKTAPTDFELLRSYYPIRREPKAYFKFLSSNMTDQLGKFWLK